MSLLKMCIGVRSIAFKEILKEFADYLQINDERLVLIEDLFSSKLLKTAIWRVVFFRIS